MIDWSPSTALNAECKIYQPGQPAYISQQTFDLSKKRQRAYDCGTTYQASRGSPLDLPGRDLVKFQGNQRAVRKEGFGLSFVCILFSDTFTDIVGEVRVLTQPKRTLIRLRVRGSSYTYTCLFGCFQKPWMEAKVNKGGSILPSVPDVSRLMTPHPRICSPANDIYCSYETMANDVASSLRIHSSAARFSSCSSSIFPTCMLSTPSSLPTARRADPDSVLTRHLRSRFTSSDA